MNSLKGDIWNLVATILKECWGSVETQVAQMTREVIYIALLGNPSLPALLKDWTVYQVAECVANLTKVSDQKPHRTWQTVNTLISNPNLAELVRMYYERQELHETEE